MSVDLLIIFIENKKMNTEELYNILENESWLEPTNKEHPVQNMQWLFYQPANDLKGLYMLEYTHHGRPQKESGEYKIEMNAGQPVIKIKEAEFYLSFKNSDNTMIWKTKTESEKIRTLIRGNENPS